MKYQSDILVLISTDKAVRPTSIMGASKRLAEIILQSMQEVSTHTIFTMVRFGNVLGSSGSVVPLFKEQIKNGGPITITHVDIIRYFMTISEAVQLVIQASNMAIGSDVFILDMGNPVKIVDLARKMIHLSGFSIKDANNIDGDIEIKITGLRPGEKLYEELLINDKSQTTSHPRIMKANEPSITYAKLEQQITQLNIAINDFNYTQTINILNTLVTNYKQSSTTYSYLN